MKEIFGRVVVAQVSRARCCPVLPASSATDHTMSVATMSQALQRPSRGSRVSSFYPQAPPEGLSLAMFDSAFQLQEYLSMLVRQNPHDVERIVSVPGKAKSSENEKDGIDEGLEKDGKEASVDEACWIYEQLR